MRTFSPVSDVPMSFQCLSAGGIGASLANLFGGYSHYIIPTFIIKRVMALIMGYVINKMSGDSKFKWIIGATLGSIWQIGAYYIVGSIMIGSFASTIMNIVGNALQSIIGIIVSVIFIVVFKNTSAGKKIFSNLQSKG